MLFRGAKALFVPARRKIFVSQFTSAGSKNGCGIFTRRAGTNGLLMSQIDESAERQDFEGLVERYYRSLYQFAFSLSRSEAEACDLTQQTFYIWATKGSQLRDASKVKSWLFTTL